MRLYYSVVDPYPAYRADVAELFAVELSKLGLETEWFMNASSQQVGNVATFANQTVHLPAQLKTTSKLFGKLNYWFSDAKHLLSLLWRAPDAIQCRDKYWASLVGLAVARMRGIPFIYWCSYPFPEHDALAADLQVGFKKTLGKVKASLRHAILYRWICRRADHVFVQSQRMQQDMATYGISLTKMTPVPMGVSASIFNWTKANQIAVMPDRIVYLGTLAAVRKLDMVLDAFAIVKRAVPNATLMFVGDGDVPSERLALQARAAELELAESITFTGFIPMEEAWAISASAALCLSPFYPTAVLASTSPTKLVEYLVLGRPVVCNDHPEQSQIIQESGAGICVPWSSEAFAEACIRLLRSPETAAAMAKRGPGWVSENRTYPQIAMMVYKKYLGILGSK